MDVSAVSTDEKKCMLAEHLRTRLGHNRPKAVSSVTGRGVSGGCTSLGRLSAQGKRIPCRQHDEGEERRFPARFSLWNMNRCNEKNRNVVFFT